MSDPFYTYVQNGSEMGTCSICGAAVFIVHAVQHNAWHRERDDNA